MVQREAREEEVVPKVLNWHMVSSPPSSKQTDQTTLWMALSTRPCSVRCLFMLLKGKHSKYTVCTMLHPTHPVAPIFSPTQTFHYLEQRKRQSAHVMPQKTHAEPSAKSSQQQDESWTGRPPERTVESFRLEETSKIIQSNHPLTINTAH